MTWSQCGSIAANIGKVPQRLFGTSAQRGDPCHEGPLTQVGMGDPRRRLRCAIIVAQQKTRLEPHDVVMAYRGGQQFGRPPDPVQRLGPPIRAPEGPRCRASYRRCTG